jgi:hypothetical protein
VKRIRLLGNSTENPGGNPCLTYGQPVGKLRFSAPRCALRPFASLRCMRSRRQECCTLATPEQIAGQIQPRQRHQEGLRPAAGSRLGASGDAPDHHPSVPPMRNSDRSRALQTATETQAQGRVLPRIQRVAPLTDDRRANSVRIIAGQSACLPPARVAATHGIGPAKLRIHPRASMAPLHSRAIRLMKGRSNARRGTIASADGRDLSASSPPTERPPHRRDRAKWVLLQQREPYAGTDHGPAARKTSGIRTRTSPSSDPRPTSVRPAAKPKASWYNFA